MESISPLSEPSALAWVSWITLLLAVATPIALVAFKTSITTWITKGIEHDFEVKLENLRATLRTSEEQFKSALRDKETEIDALRNNVLSGTAGRQTLLDKRRFEAVEKIWTAVNDVAQLKIISQTMALLDQDVIAKQTQNQNVQLFLEAMDTTASDSLQLKNLARYDRPFVPEIAWAYFSAFNAVLFFNLARLKVLRSGVQNPQSLMNTEHIKKVLKAALPHQAPFIDEQDPSLYHYLLDDIEDKLLIELREVLDGKETDKSQIQRGKEILNAHTSPIRAALLGGSKTTVTPAPQLGHMRRAPLTSPEGN